jgi:hypothetical protein
VKAIGWVNNQELSASICRSRNNFFLCIPDEIVKNVLAKIARHLFGLRYQNKTLCAAAALHGSGE